jgi:DNA-binding transcriptional regulator YiaG
MPALVQDEPLNISTGTMAASAFTLGAALVTISLLWVPQEITASTYLIAKPTEQTTASPARLALEAATETTGEAILEIRRRSGLTWEELADLFDVSRRSVHHWASGKAVTAEHDRQIRRTLAVVRQLDQGGAEHTRALLVSPRADGQIVLDLVKSGAFAEALTSSGAAQARPRLSPTQTSEGARRRRRPPPPAELVGALPDRPDSPASGQSRVARVWRAPKAES